MKKSLFYFTTLLLLLAVVAPSCSKKENLPDQEPTTSLYKISIPASMATTKAVSDGGVATFTTSDKVYVYNSTTRKLDANYLSPDANGKDVKLVGTLTETYSVGNELTLIYKGDAEGAFDFSNQDGTLSNVLDAALATVQVAKVDGSTIETSAADFINQSSIFKFTFKKRSDASTLNVKSVNISSEGNALVSRILRTGTSEKSDLAFYNTTALSTVYLSLNFISTPNDPITFMVTDADGKLYTGVKNAPSSGFSTGKFYTSTMLLDEIPGIFYYYGTANCLLLANNATSGTLSVAPYKTNSQFRYTGTSAAGETPSATKAEVIWEESAGFITSATISGTTMTVNKQSGVYGNAVVGIYDASDNLLWSYHIWAPEDNPTTLAYTQTLSGQTYNVMNMPIGATKALTAASSDEDKVKGFGLYYQWGRKDPLGRANAIASNTIKPVYDKDGNAVTLTSAAYIKDITDALSGYTDEATDGPMSHFMARYAIANPATFIKVPSNQYSNDWAGETNNNLWGNSYPNGTYPKMNQIYKSIFDPSPAGYRVAPQDTWVNFTSTKANSTDKTTFNVVGNEGFNWTATTLVANRGYEFYCQGLGTGPSHFYGASGYRGRSMGAVGTVGVSGYFWSSSALGVGASILYFNAAGVYPLNSYNRAYGFPVLCVKE